MRAGQGAGALLSDERENRETNKQDSTDRGTIRIINSKTYDRGTRGAGKEQSATDARRAMRGGAGKTG